MSGPAAALIIPLSTRAAPIVRRQLSVFVNVSALIIISMNIHGAEWVVRHAGNARCRKKTQLVTLL
ncbi:TPA: hypothetical protein MIM87_12550 [Klebsiella variicola]|nr:hypothetical protein [Klebsiella variicola]HBX9997934.1 hypothetical protein [Klebsiella variicola]